MRDVAAMTGEQLLLLRVLGGQEVREQIDRQLDRRAVLGPPPPRRAPRRTKVSMSTPVQDGLRVA